MPGWEVSYIVGAVAHSGAASATLSDIVVVLTGHTVDGGHAGERGRIGLGAGLPLLQG